MLAFQRKRWVGNEAFGSGTGPCQLALKFSNCCWRKRRAQPVDRGLSTQHHWRCIHASTVAGSTRFLINFPWLLDGGMQEEMRLARAIYLDAVAKEGVADQAIVNREV